MCKKCGLLENISRKEKKRKENIEKEENIRARLIRKTRLCDEPEGLKIFISYINVLPAINNLLTVRYRIKNRYIVNK